MSGCPLPATQLPYSKEKLWKHRLSRAVRTTCHQFSSDSFCTPVWNQPLGDVSLGPRGLDGRIARQESRIVTLGCLLCFPLQISYFRWVFFFFLFLFPLQTSASFVLYVFNFAVTVPPPTFPLMWTHPGVGNMRHSCLSSSELPLLVVVWLRVVEGHGESIHSHML